MRSVVVYLRDAMPEEVRQLLQRTCTAQAGPPWVWECEGDVCLYIWGNAGGDDDFRSDPEVQRSVLTALGCPPTVTVRADVSGRHPGDNEVRALVSALLRAYPGVAQDDYTSHSWTLDEVLTGQTVEQHPFFDYRGWHGS